jgi:hypothetical protein
VKLQAVIEEMPIFRERIHVERIELSLYERDRLESLIN